MLCTLLSITTFAHDFEVDRIYYRIGIDKTEVYVTHDSSRFPYEYEGEVVIPEKVEYNGETYRVARICGDAFQNCSYLTSVTIPSSVTEIVVGAFSGCSSLTSVTIPSSVTAIRMSAFENCSSLTSITIPSSVTSIGSSAFSGCSSLTSVTIPSGVTSIGSHAFSDCANLPVIDGIRYADSYAVETVDKSLTSYSIKEGTRGIASSVFNECSRLASITIPSSVKFIGSCAFQNCFSLTSISIPSSVTSIDFGTFRNCARLTSIIIPGSVTSIEGNAFEGCSKLTSVIIPSSVTSISSFAFMDCPRLNSITIPSSVTSIGNDAFYDCISLPVIDGIRYADSYAVEAVDKSLTSCSIKEGTRFIGNEAFQGCSSLTSVTIPSSVTSISFSAFYYCSSLTSISIPSSVTIIENNAFYGCSNLASVTIPSSVTSILPYAFAGCSGLTSIISYNRTPPIVYPDNYALFDDVPKSLTVYVPIESVAKYKAAPGWSEFNNILPIKINVNITEGDATYSNDDKECESITYTRNFKNTNWQALYIPFSMSYDDWKDDFEVAKINSFYEYDMDDDGEIDKRVLEIIKVQSGELLPNHPYMIKAKITGEKTITVENTTLYATEESSIDCSTVETKYSFVGTYHTVTGMKTAGYKFLSGGALCNASSDATALSPFRWYLMTESRGGQLKDSGSAAIKIRVVGEEDEEEADAIEVVKADSASGKIYGVDGRMVSSDGSTEGLKPGIYIKNGHKYIIK